ncbi:glycosyltransferase family 2 protein [Parabacteroides bouchesdurhonensis]|uniref:glycosyltransferase family 2 protein n=1 Tax=Parabacteroides bouchesdurhonensis TaxID=1936995 RepID=UPI000C83826F|nr:glycosyltransferase family 2 protein [Parabacteroides bouchesdurhonensis]
MSRVDVSIILSVYNREKYLCKCLDSILYQSFTDWECLVVDDGSTDGCSAIAEEYAKKDSRFRIFHQENGGVSAARNRGLDHATGKYISFVDSDDFIDIDYLRALYERMTTNGLSMGGLKVSHLNGEMQERLPIADCFLVDRTNEQKLTDLYDSWLLYAPVCKLYDRNLIEANGLRFCKEINYGEDVVFNFTYLLYVDTISVVQKLLYNVVKVENSLSYIGKVSPMRVHNANFEAVVRFYKTKNILGEYSKNIIGGRYFFWTWMMCRSVLRKHGEMSFAERYRYLADAMSEINKEYLFNSLKGYFLYSLLLKSPLSVFLYFEIAYLCYKLTGKLSAEFMNVGL